MNRYILAGVIGVIAASLELFLARKLAGSYGAESDAWHAYADSGFIFVSAILAYWKHYDKERFHLIDDLGTVINSLFFFAASWYIFDRLLSNEQTVSLSGRNMFFAAGVGLVGNFVQFFAMGEKETERTSDMYLSTKGHLFSDVLFSLSVLFASAIVIIMGVGVNFVYQCIVGAMLTLVASYLVIQVVDTEEWEPKYWTMYTLLMCAVTALVIALIVNGSQSAVDKITAVLLGVAMALAGIYYLTGLVQDRLTIGYGRQHDHHH